MFDFNAIQEFRIEPKRKFDTFSGTNLRTLIEVDEMDAALDFKLEYPFFFDQSMNDQDALQVMQANIHHYLADRHLVTFPGHGAEILHILGCRGIETIEHSKTALYMAKNFEFSPPVYAFSYINATDQAMILTRGKLFHMENTQDLYGAATMIDHQARLKDFLTLPYKQALKSNPNHWGKLKYNQRQIQE